MIEQIKNLPRSPAKGGQVLLANVRLKKSPIEGFQKRLFEKKKFVTETNRCVTLDHVPESLYLSSTTRPNASIDDL